MLSDSKLPEDTKYFHPGAKIETALAQATAVPQAILKLGFGTAVFGLGSNSRIRGVVSRSLGRFKI